MPVDSLGNPVTLDEAASLARVDDFVQGLLRYEPRAVALLDIADGESGALVQAYAAALQMFAETPGAPAAAKPHVERAQAAAARATPRERRFVAATAAWVAGDIDRAIALHEEQAAEFPRDLVSVKLGQYHLFNRGDAPGMLRLARAVLPAAGDVPQLHGMLAFGWEQCHYLREAEAAAQQALAGEPGEPWAHHALAHVMLTEGRIAEGQQFLSEMAPHWAGLNSFMRTHNWWHAALFAIELEQFDAALRLYDQEVWGVLPAYSQDQINAVSLLARLELAGADVGARWQDLATWLAPRVADQVLAFLDLQYLYGLARAGRPEADQLLAHLTERAAQDPAWREIALPAAQGLLAHARGRHADAVQALARALPRLREIGGSHAQRDLFQQIYIDALARSGQLAEAQNLVQQQARQQPASRRLQRQGHALAQALGIA
ncbi:tetratricopeptide repeat protein [Pseudorhodoferax sp.]|uniref:tetratricopeptide repeat protein n=1 Tax=Pseudorhodoferax sp. TaxID=1993553 RepID=UPI002DD62C89|nr:tetratricopeptide repeat protein [Pseudorhodoferax sp.]